MPYSIAPTSYGYRITVDGVFSPEEATGWFDEIRRITASKPSFSQFVDIRKQLPNPAGTSPIVEEAMKWVCDHGLKRSAVIVESPTLRMQIMRLAKKSGMYAYERYFAASEDPDWERHALAWLEQGTDPDL